VTQFDKSFGPSQPIGPSTYNQFIKKVKTPKESTGSELDQKINLQKYIHPNLMSFFLRKVKLISFFLSTVSQAKSIFCKRN